MVHMKGCNSSTNTKVVLVAAVLTFAVATLMALLPKSPTEPPQLPEIVRRVAGEIGGKYWWALLVGGLIAVRLERRVLWQLVLTLVASQILIETLKIAVGEMRPDGRFFNSFPSGHTTASFAYATVMSAHFRWGWLWFLFAAAVGISRIITHAHWWHDVVGGAALGYIVAVVICGLSGSVQRKINRTNASSAPEQPKHHGASGQSETQGSQNAGRGE